MSATVDRYVMSVDCIECGAQPFDNCDRHPGIDHDTYCAEKVHVAIPSYLSQHPSRFYRGIARLEADSQTTV